MKKKIALCACVLAAVIAPWVLPPYYVTLLVPFFGYSIILLGFNLLFGYGGQLSFGHALFVAVGAYAAAAANSYLGVESFELMLLTAIAAAFLLSIPIALIASRFTGIFFGMLTLSFGMLFHSILFKFYNLTGGESGMRIPRPSLLNNPLEDLDKTEFLIGPFYYYCLILTLALGLIMWRLVQSPYGLHLMAARDNSVKAIYLGVKVRWVRTLAFIVSAVYGGIGGVILGVNTGLADPELSYWTHSGHLVFMTVLGGYQEFLGPVVGTLVLIFVQDKLMTETQYWRFFVGLALAVIVVAMPGGILGAVRKFKLKRKPHADTPAASTTSGPEYIEALR